MQGAVAEDEGGLDTAAPHSGYFRRGAEASSAPVRRRKNPSDLFLFAPHRAEGEGENTTHHLPIK